MRNALLGLAALAAMALWGCKSSTEPVEDELSVLQEMIASDAFFTSDQSMLGDADQYNLGKTAAPILPWAWGRRIDSVSRSVSFVHFGDTVIVATINVTISGQIKIAAKDSLQDTTITVVSKPFTETMTRNVRFYRVARTARPRDNWRFREVSGVEGGTANSQITFDQLVAIIGPDTLTITDPTEFYLRFPAFAGRRLPSIGSGAMIKVQLTLTSTESDTDMVFIHRPFQWLNISTLRPARTRMTMVSQTGSGPYTRVYEHSWTGHVQGRHHFFVSGITRNSLFDDAAPWSTRLWGIPYLVP
jgi:hypothetical protein